MRRTLSLTAALVLAGFALTRGPRGDDDPLRVLANVGLAAGVLVFAIASRFSRGELGLAPSRAQRGVGIGALAALGLGVPAAVGVLLAPLVFGEPLHYEPLEGRSAEGLAVHVLIWFPLQTAIPEEIVFRGVVLAAWQRVTSSGRAQLVTAGAYALWHLAVVYDSVSSSGVAEGPVLFGLLYLAAIAAIGVAGLLFGVMRSLTGSLAAPIMAHWVVVGLIRLAVWLRAS